MGKKLYTDSTEEYSDVPEMLKSLPKVNAPDDFEYNLMVKIENKQFEPNIPVTESTGLFWRWMPTTAFALSVFLVFFLMDFNPNENDNLQPEKVNTVLEAGVNNKISLKKVVNENKNNLAKKSNSRANSIATETSSDNSAKEYPFNPRNNVDVDDVLTEGVNGNNSSGLKLVGHGNTQQNFRGFELRFQEDTEKLKEMKAKMDSSYKAKQEAKDKKSK